MDTIPETALETVAVKQCHEELKVLLLAVVRCRRHEQEMAAEFSKLLAQAVALGVFDLATEIAGRHPVCLVADDQIPLVRLAEPLLQFLIPGKHVKPGYQPVVVIERIARTRRVDHVAGEDVELETKFLAELVLPLLDQASWCHNQTPLKVAACNQFSDQQPGHDRLSRTRIIRQQKTQRLAHQHFTVNRRDLVRQGINETGVDCEIGIEQMSKRDPVRLRNESQHFGVTVKRPLPAACLDIQACLVVAVERGFRNAPIRLSVCQIDRLIADPFDGQDSDRLPRNHTLDRGTGLDVLKNGHCRISRALPRHMRTHSVPIDRVLRRIAFQVSVELECAADFAVSQLPFRLRGCCHPRRQPSSVSWHHCQFQAARTGTAVTPVSFNRRNSPLALHRRSLRLPSARPRPFRRGQQ